MSQAELALIKMATPCVSIHRLAKGQFGFKGNCISLSNSGPSIALSLPRTVDDAGLQIIVDRGGKGKALSDPAVRRAFNVRRGVIERVLYLLIKQGS